MTNPLETSKQRSSTQAIILVVAVLNGLTWANPPQGDVRVADLMLNAPNQYDDELASLSRSDFLVHSLLSLIQEPQPTSPSPLRRNEPEQTDGQARVAVRSNSDDLLIEDGDWTGTLVAPDTQNSKAGNDSSSTKIEKGRETPETDATSPPATTTVPPPGNRDLEVQQPAEESPESDDSAPSPAESNQPQIRPNPIAEISDAPKSAGDDLLIPNGNWTPSNPQGTENPPQRRRAVDNPQESQRPGPDSEENRQPTGSPSRLRAPHSNPLLIDDGDWTGNPAVNSDAGQNHAPQRLRQPETSPPDAEKPQALPPKKDSLLDDDVEWSPFSTKNTSKDKSKSDDEDDDDDDDDDDAESKDDSKDNSDAADAHSNADMHYMHLKQGHVPYDPRAFSPDPRYDGDLSNPSVEMGVYSGKYLNTTERPWIELGRGLYLPGPIPPSQNFFGETNPTAQHFLAYGDFRTATAYNQFNGTDKVVWANRLNLDLDWKLTSTERIHAFIGPLDKNNQFTRTELNHGDIQFFEEFDKNFDTIFFEGDLGALIAGWTGTNPNLDLPFAVGLVPLLFQNGIWFEDAIVGAALSFPAKNSARFDWPNFDVTIFAGIDKLNSPAFFADDSAASVFGAHWFLEAYDGYFECGYAYLDDTSGLGLSYHNIGASFSRRYWHRISNAVRVIVNSGQDPLNPGKTANGQLFLLENALITHKPNTLVPYFNLFAGFGSPQSVARAAAAGGVLRNTGILFETDGLTGFAFLDDTANNTAGGAIGVNVLGDAFDWQFILEAAMVHTFGQGFNRRAVGDQYGVAARYQKPLNHAWILRMDAMYGFLENAPDANGVRCELRYKF
ncbi:MAG: hypothetical protein R3C28_24670 [Pirellulaceae bacterium]